MGETANILIVDDNVNLAKTMSLILRRKGFTVTAAKDGTQTIKKVRETPFDVIFMDIKMSFMNGVETYRRIKKIRPEAVVIMMTAYRQEMANFVAEALDSNAYSCLYKPFNIEELFMLIRETQEKKQKQRDQQ